MNFHNKFRILIFVDWYYPIGGIEVFLTNLINKISSYAEIGLAVREFNGQSDFSCLENSAKIFRLKNNLWKESKKIINAFSPNVIHLNNMMLSGLAALFVAKRKNIPVVFTNHRIPEYKTFNFFIFKNLSWKYVRWFNNRCDLITAPSETVVSFLKQHGITKSITVSCGVDTKRFCPGNQNVAQKLLGLPNNIPIILFVGRYSDPEKNIDLLIKAGEILKNNIYDFRIVLVGFKLFKGLKKLINKSKIKNKIIEMGFIPNNSNKLLLVYQSADIFVIPSVFETQSIATLEALASGIPVIASNSGALPELIKDGENGFLFHKENIDDLSKKLTMFFMDSNKAKKMATMARKSAMPHSLQIIAENWIKIYEKATKIRK
ncbi:MAG: glycosyltransferase [Candidatus Kuenenbacteria bacterium]